MLTAPAHGDNSADSLDPLALYRDAQGLVGGYDVELATNVLQLKLDGSPTDVAKRCDIFVGLALLQPGKTFKLVARQGRWGGAHQPVIIAALQIAINEGT